MHVDNQQSAAAGKWGRETMARIPPVRGCGLESAGVRPVRVLSPLQSSIAAGTGAENEAAGVCVFPSGKMSACVEVERKKPVASEDIEEGFPGGPGLKTLLCNARDTG